MSTPTTSLLVTKSAQTDSNAQASVPFSNSSAAPTAGIGSSSSTIALSSSSTLAAPSVNTSSISTVSSSVSVLASSNLAEAASTVSASTSAVLALSSSSAGVTASVSSSISTVSSSSSSSISSILADAAGSTNTPIFEKEELDDPIIVRPSIFKRAFFAVYSSLALGWHTAIYLVTWIPVTLYRFVTCFFMLSDNQRLEKFAEEVLRLTPEEISEKSSDLNTQMDELIVSIQSTDGLLNLFRFASDNIFKTEKTITKAAREEIAKKKLNFAMKILGGIDQLTQNDWQRIEEKLTLSESLDLLNRIYLEINKQDGQGKLQIIPPTPFSSPATSNASASSSSISSATFSTSSDELNKDKAFYSLVEVIIRRVGTDDISSFLDFTVILLDKIKSESVRKNWLDAISEKIYDQQLVNRFLDLFFNLMGSLSGKSLKNWAITILKKSFFNDSQKDRLLGIIQKQTKTFEPNDLAGIVREFLNDTKFKFNDKSLNVLYSFATYLNDETLVKEVKEKASDSLRITWAKEYLQKDPDNRDSLLTTMRLIGSKSKDNLLAFIKEKKPETIDILITEARNNNLITEAEARSLVEFNTEQKIAQIKESLRKAPDDRNLLLSVMRLIGSRSKDELINFIRNYPIPTVMRDFIKVVRRNGLITTEDWALLVEKFYVEAWEKYDEALFTEAQKLYVNGFLDRIRTPSREAVIKQADFNDQRKHQIRMEAYEELTGYSKA